MSDNKYRIKQRLKIIDKEHTGLRKPIRAAATFYKKITFHLETAGVRPDKRIVVFASFAGRSYSDSPRALFEYMLNCGEFDDYTMVWGFGQNLEEHRARLKRLQREAIAARGIKRGGARVIAVQYGSKAWKRYVAAAGYWIFNFKLEDYLKPKKNQVFVQTWHGTPLKRLGYDLEHFDNVLNTEKGIKKRYGIEIRKIDWFLSPSPYATEKFRSAWRMEDFDKADIILEEGYPRNDILFQYSREKRDRVMEMVFGACAGDFAGKTIVLYAPTYRQDQHQSGVGYTYRETIDFAHMREQLGDNFVILFRAHYFIASQFNFHDYEGFVYDVSEIEDIDELYLISDILVTDYSSTMFDFANLKRPMVFYMYDLEHYRDESNGFYFNPEEELPGPIVKTNEELTTAIRDVAEHFVYDDTYRRFNEKFDPLDDGHVSERVVKRIFGIS